MRFARFLAAITGLYLLSGPLAQAETTVETINRLARSAELVVEGQVVSTESRWDRNRQRIITRVTLDIGRYHRGNGKDTITLNVLGGTVDEISLWISHQPRFAPGEEVIVFVAPHRDQRPDPVVGGDLGKFLLSVDPDEEPLLSNSVFTVDKRFLLAIVEAFPTPPEKGRERD